MRSFDEVPLFMRNLPSGGTDESNTALDALQALAYEGHPDDAAKNFKEQGNEYFRAKRYREAIGFYRQGLDAKPGSKELLESLYLNCAACNLELRTSARLTQKTTDARSTTPATRCSSTPARSRRCTARPKRSLRSIASTTRAATCARA